jgi:chemotaxis protein CheY-P-specific phosphatase CheC
MELNTIEQAKAQGLVKQGMEKAAQSLGFFLKNKVELLSVENDSCNLSHTIQVPNKLKQRGYLLSTYILGELKGACYLLFTQDEVDMLLKSEFSEEILQDEEMKNAMGEGLLLEMDNIISANVITEFANTLKVKIYGDVPSISYIEQNEVFDVMAQAVNEEMFILNFRANFTNNEQNFNPEFIWLFDQQFLEKIKNS